MDYSSRDDGSRIPEEPWNILEPLIPRAVASAEAGVREVVCSSRSCGIVGKRRSVFLGVHLCLAKTPYGHPGTGRRCLHPLNFWLI
jgi:hypothetical protein